MNKGGNEQEPIWLQHFRNDAPTPPSPQRVKLPKIPVWAAVVPAVAVVGIAAAIHRPWERTSTPPTEAPVGGQLTPGVLSEPTAEPSPPQRTPRELATILLAPSTKNIIVYDQDGRLRERNEVDLLSKLFVGGQLQFLESGRLFPDTGILTSARVGDQEYDLTDSTQLIVASSLLD